MTVNRQVVLASRPNGAPNPPALRNAWQIVARELEL